MITISNITAKITAGKLTARQAVEQAYAAIEKAVDFNVIIGFAKERALQRADEIDAKLKRGEKVGSLAGVPFIAKDNFLTLGSKTTAASNILKNFEAPYQSTAIERLEAEGAIMIAKANLDAFAHGSSTENSDFGPTKNPVNNKHVPGGSSGGSAAAVALGIVPFTLGTDTGGSIRLPASFCGVVGVKPTYGTVSRFGVLAMASSTDVIGPMANTVEDAARVMDIIAGRDARDSTTLEKWTDSFMPSKPKKLKIGIVKEYMTNDVQPEVRDAVLQKAEELRRQGHMVEEVSIPSVNLALAIYYIVVPAEVSSNLSRYDGIKFGYSDRSGGSLAELYAASRGQGFNAENKRRIVIGTYVLSSGYIDAYYHKAQTVRTKLINEFVKAFKEYDVLLGPVAPSTAFKLGENTHDPLTMYLADIMTVAASLAGLPALSVPAGNDKAGLPIGIQLIGEQRSDALLFSVAKQLEGGK